MCQSSLSAGDTSDSDEDAAHEKRALTRWTAEEDAQLEEICLAEIATGDPIVWTKVSDKLGTRTSKQCRERWVNHQK